MNITLEHIVTALNKAKIDLVEITNEKARDEMEWDSEDDPLIAIAAGAVAALKLIVESVVEEISVEEDILRDDKGFPMYGSAGTGKSGQLEDTPND